MLIRIARQEDHPALWAILEPVIRAGQTYTLPLDMTREEALGFWLSPGHEVFVAEDEGQVVGTYFLRANHKGPGAHVANCGYVTRADRTGRGIARGMCAHSLDRARERGFRAMQFNFVVSTNERAIGLWQSMGFRIVGQLPAAFLDAERGYVDALVMYRSLV